MYFFKSLKDETPLVFSILGEAGREREAAAAAEARRTEQAALELGRQRMLLAASERAAHRQLRVCTVLARHTRLAVPWPPDRAHDRAHDVVASWPPDRRAHAGTTWLTPAPPTATPSPSGPRSAARRGRPKDEFEWGGSGDPTKCGYAHGAAPSAGSSGVSATLTNGR